MRHPECSQGATLGPADVRQQVWSSAHDQPVQAVLQRKATEARSTRSARIGVERAGRAKKAFR